MTKVVRLALLARWGGISFLAGVAIQTCFAALVPLATLRGPALADFLAYYLIAGAAYAVAVARLGRDRLSLRAIWAFAILFRLTLLLTSPPTLSDDVYRFIWDGRLASAGVSPYAQAVESPILDPFDSPQRGLVNNSEMASPYLPTAQALFAAAYWLFPNSALVFQVVAVLLDLLTGWLVVDMLGRLGTPRGRALIYLWNPLVCIEFAHGAHVVDALMMFMTMATFWLLILAWPNFGVSLAERNRRSKALTWGSVVTLAAATLTKGLPALMISVVVWRWRWVRVLVYAGLVLAVSLPFALRAGWGLTGPPDGTGLLGAVRIYARYWNYNGGLYHWLEVVLSGYKTPGAVSPDVVGPEPIRAAKSITAALLALVLLAVAWGSWRYTRARSVPDPPSGSPSGSAANLAMLRLAVVPPAAYLLLTTTVHPWYVTLLIPLLPFLLPKQGEATHSGRFLWPWIYFSIAVAFSYSTYWDPDNLREYRLVRQVEYLPLYALLIWAALPVIYESVIRKA
jgi:alpha-1,6-mannosyltransferase